MSEPQRKIALVTGAGSGVGRASANALAKEGYTVIVTGRRVDKLEETMASAGSNAIVITSDVSNPESVHALFDQIRKRFGRLDVLFNNAGVGAPAVPIDELPFETWQKVINTNLSGVFLCTQAAVKLMKEQNPRGGRIINNGSISAHTPRPHSAPYTASKHGVLGLTKSTALDGRPFNIACGQIDIGNASTSLTARMANGVPQANGTKLAEPTIDADHIARAVVYMAGLPLDANVLNMTVMATQMPFVGRG